MINQEQLEIYRTSLQMKKIYRRLNEFLRSTAAKLSDPGRCYALIGLFASEGGGLAEGHLWATSFRFGKSDLW